MQVVVSVEVDYPNEAHASPRNMTFTPEDWNVPQLVSVIGRPVSATSEWRLFYWRTREREGER